MKFLKQLLQSSIATAVMLAIVGFFMLIQVIPFNSEILVQFLIGAVFLVVGQAVFLTAIDGSIIKTGRAVGSALMKYRKIWIIIIFGFLFGFVSTLAEPDIQVLVEEITGSNAFLPNWLLLGIFSASCGLFICFGLVRILKSFPLKYILLVIYGIILVLCCFVPESYIGISFDAGGATTGCVTVPFILALSIGICAIRAKNSKNDTFGVVAIASTGPILAMLILGIIFGAPTASGTEVVETVTFISTVLSVLKSVALAFAPLILTFIIAQIFIIKLPMKEVIQILIGFLMSAIGLILFLTGIYYGFEVMGKFIGENLLISPRWLFMIMGACLAFCMVFTDPAIVILVEQVEEVTAGLLHKKVIYIVVALGVVMAVLLSFVHIIFGISLLYILLPFVALSIILNFFIPKIFTAIAFDSGGIASGTMAVGFILPICIGMCKALEIDELIGGFGIIGLVATMPIIAVQIFGLIYRIKSDYLKKKEAKNNEKTEEV